MIELTSSRFKLSQVGLPDDGSSAESRFVVDVDPAGSDSRFKVETVGSGQLGLGVPSEPQESWLTVTHNGVKRHDGELVDTEFGLAPDGSDFQLATHGFEGDEIAGTETQAWHGRAVDRGAAPPGSDEIDLGWDVNIPGIGEVSYPILTGGRVWSSTEALIGHDPTDLQGNGYLSRFEGVEVSYVKAVGEAKTHGVIIPEILALAGVPAERIAISPSLGHPLENILELRCADGVAEAKAIAEAAGHVLVDAPDGTIVARPIAPVDLAPVAEINIEDLETSEISPSISADTRDVPLCWRIIGSRPEIPEASDGFSSFRRKESETIEPYTTPDKFNQSGAGALTLATAGSTEDRIVSQVFVTEIFFKGCLVRRIQETWGQFNPEVWRYQTNSTPSSDGTPFTYNTTGYVFDDSAVADDASPMHQFFNFRLMAISVQQEDFILSGPILPATGLPDPHSGPLVQILTSVSEWKTLERAWKVKTVASNTFDEENVQASVRFFGGGRPIMGLGGASEASGFAQELWFKGPAAPTFASGGVAGMGGVTLGGNDSLPGEPSGVRKISKYATQGTTDITPVFIDSGDGRTAGHESGRVIVTTGYGFPTDGDQFEYRNGTKRGTGSVEGAKIETESQTFTPEGEGSHAVGTTTTDGLGRFLSSVVESGQAGYLPNLDICTPEIIALQSTAPVHGKACLVSVKGDFTNRTQTDTVGFGVETQEAATALARDRLRDRSALIATLSLPVSGIWYSKMPISFTAKHKGIDPANYAGASNAWVETVRVRAPRDGGGVVKVAVLTIKVPVI